MRHILLVGMGGFIGAVLRYRVSSLILHHTRSGAFPTATFVVNVVGCLIAGVLMALSVKHDLLTSATRVFVFTGLLGGFTTFSAFGLETVYLIQRQQFTIAAAYVMLTVLTGIGAFYAATVAIR